MLESQVPMTYRWLIERRGWSMHGHGPIMSS